MCFGVKRLTYRRLRVYGWKQVLPLVSLRIYPVLTRIGIFDKGKKKKKKKVGLCALIGIGEYRLIH